MCSDCCLSHFDWRSRLLGLHVAPCSFIPEWGYEFYSLFLTYWLICWLFSSQFPRVTQSDAFVQPTLQKPKTLHFLSKWQTAADRHIEEAATSKRVRRYQNKWHLIFLKTLVFLYRCFKWICAIMIFSWHADLTSSEQMKPRAALWSLAPPGGCRPQVGNLMN